MTPAQFQKRMLGQPPLAVQVYEAVPIAQAWTVTQVHAELRRQGKARDIRMVVGLLNKLTEARLVRENPIGHFQRIEVSQPTPSSNLTEPEMPQATVQANKTAVDQIAPLAQQLAQLANNLLDVSRQLETAALEIDEKMQGQGDAVELLSGLRKLLKT